jgi:pyruvate/2-oxoglutarate dehydrogenase complex dihydrolipoamide dehydrogenase (E3) component
VAEEHDLIVVGMGVGGEEVAGRAANAGLDVLAVERKLVGGECPYWGCIPSKVMVRAGNSLAEAARVTGLAGDATISPQWAPVARRVREVTAGWDDARAVERHEKKGSTIVRGDARLIGPGSVEVDDRRFRARRGVVVATGSEPSVPPIEGLETVDFWTNREAIEATELPGSLVVLGAGAVGLELAQTFRRFGTRVAVVEVADRVLAMEEPENSAALREVLVGEEIEVLTGAGASSVKTSNGGVAVELSDGRVVEAERLLVATGRRAELRRLGLDSIGLDPEGKGIPTDGRMRAGNGVWAVGDVTGKAAFTHLAVYQGRVAAADILGADHAPADYTAIPRVTFTDPEVAGVGLTQVQAEEAGIDVRTGVSETSSSTRGWIHGPGAEHGVTKLVADARRGVLVGASVMGPAAGEVAGFFVLAIKEQIPVAALRELIYPYPTFVRGVEDALRQVAR